MAMTESTETDAAPVARPGARRRNIILGVILACASFFMYFSIFVRLYESPLQ